MRGTASPEALCRRAKALGYDALALTDTNGFYGLPEFLRVARQQGIMYDMCALMSIPAEEFRISRFACQKTKRLFHGTSHVALNLS